MKINGLRKVISLILAVIFVVSAVSTTTVSAATTEKKTKWLTFSELVEQKGYVNGVQQPWFSDRSTGNCWSYSYMDGYSATRWDEDAIREVIYNTKAMGFDCLKLWCMYNRAGMLFDSYGTDGEWNVIGIHPKYLENLEKIFQMAEEYGLYICLATVNHAEGNDDQTSSLLYEKRSRFIWDKTAREGFFNNYIGPIIELTKSYDNVVLIDLFVEPEAEGGEWSLPNGTNWDIMREFIKAQNDFVKSINPRLETYSSATSENHLIYERYSGLGLDYYGRDYYDTVGGAHDVVDAYLDRPFIYGEIGLLGDMARKDEDYVQNWWLSYLNEAVEKGVKAGFIWVYGRGPSSGNQSLLDTSARPRAAAGTIHFWALNRDYKIAGIDPDTDAAQMMYSTDYSIKFFGARGADEYRVEKTTDKKNWTKVLSFNPNTETKYEYAPSCYEVIDSNPIVGETNYYRVVAIDAEGNELASNLSNSWKIKKVECTPEENLVGNYSFEDENGFNTDGTDGKWYYGKQTGTFMQDDPSTYIKDGTPGVNTHTGTHAMYRFRILRQDVTLKPNTNYTFSFWIMHPDKQGYWTECAGLEINRTDAYVDLNANNSAIPVIRFEDDYKNGKWRRVTVHFNSGDHTEVAVNIQSYHISWSDPQTYLDDVFLFENEG